MHKKSSYIVHFDLNHFHMIRVCLKGARGFSLRIESGSCPPKNWNAIFLFSQKNIRSSITYNIVELISETKNINGVYVMLKSYSIQRVQ